MPYTYPPPAPTITGEVVTINRFLESPTAFARRMRTLLEQRYIADALLKGRFTVSGGAIQYETGEPLFSTDNPRAVAPGSEYPLTNIPSGTASLAKTVKWGQDALFTDEAIQRQRMVPVNRGMTKLANQNVRFIDSITLAVIASAVTATAVAGQPGGIGTAAPWRTTATAATILTDVAVAKAGILALNQGFDPDTVVLDDVTWAYVMAKFIAAGYLPRENNLDNPVITGEMPTIQGMVWLPTPNLPAANQALVLDSEQLGGMADEDLGGPGYVKVNGVGVETKVIRDDDNDQYRGRCRRVTVPVVLEPAAAQKITGVAS